MVSTFKKCILGFLAVVFAAALCLGLAASSAGNAAAAVDIPSDAFAMVQVGEGDTATYTFYKDADSQTLGNAFTDANAASSATITILQDRVAKVSTTLEVTGNVTLDLNGHKLDFNASAFAPTTHSPITVQKNGTLTIKDSDPTAAHKYRVEESGLYKFAEDGDQTFNGGVITGGYTDKPESGSANGGGSIYVSGTLIMEGGAIAGNGAKHNGGAVFNRGTFEIKKGVIKGNVAGNNGGGVYISGSGVFNIAGSEIDITGNDSGDGKSNNVHLNGVPIHVKSALSDGTNTAKIGVTTDNNKTITFEGFETYNHDSTLSDFFSFDDNRYCIGAAWGNGHVYATWHHDADGHWQECDNCGLALDGSVGAHNNTGADGACSVCGFKANFTVTTTSTVEYETFAEAWAAATAVSKSTLKMYVSTAGITQELTVGADKDITLDLNNGNLSVESSFAAAQVITVNGKLTIDGGTSLSGKIVASAVSVNVINVAGGELNIKDTMIVSRCNIGVKVTDNGKFAMSGDSVVNNVSDGATNAGAGVSVESGEFVMEDGSVLAGAGKGVNVAGGTFTMNGGTVSGPCAVDVTAGTFNVSGASSIKTNSDGGESVKLASGLKINVTGALTGADGDAQIYINNTGAVTSGYGANNKNGSDIIAPSTYFFADSQGYCAGLDASNEINVGEHTAAAAWSHDNDYHYHKCTNKCGELIDKAAHNLTSIVITQQPTDKTYTAFDAFDTAGMEVYTHCEGCNENIAALNNTQYSVVYVNSSGAEEAGRTYFKAGDTKVNIKYQTAASVMLKAIVTLDSAVSKKSATITWQYEKPANNWVNFATGNIHEHTFDPQTDGLKPHIRATFTDGTGNTVYYRGSNTQMSIKLGGVEQTAVNLRNVGEYSLSLKEDAFPDYDFGSSNSATLTVTPMQIDLVQVANFYWVLDGYNSKLRDGYVSTTDYKYYSTAGEGRVQVLRSIVRHRSGSVTIKLYGLHSTDNDPTNGVYSITYNGTRTASDKGKYTATAVLAFTDAHKANYEFVQSGTIENESLYCMTASISADKKSVTLSKEWYIAEIDNGLLSQQTGATYGQEWKMNDWTYGSYSAQYAPRLEHGSGDNGAHNSVVTFAANDDSVTFILSIYEDAAGGVTRKQIGEEFNRAAFANYINGSMPAGTYALLVKVKQYTETGSHTHWWNGELHDSGAAGIVFDAFEHEFNFTVKAGTLANTNINSLKDQTYEYTYDGSLHLFKDFTLSAEVYSERTGIWEQTDYDKYFGEAELKYDLKRWNTGAFLTKEEMDAYGNHSQVPKNAGNYEVTYKLFAPNYTALGGTDKFTVVVKKVSVAKPRDMDVKYRPSGYTYQAAANAGYTVVGTATYTTVNENGYNITLTLKDSDNYEWADNTGAASVTVKMIIRKAQYDMSKVSYGSLEYTYDGTKKTITVSGLPQGVTYTVGSATNAGSYNLQITFKGDSVNYEAIGSVQKTLVINKAKILVPIERKIDFDGTAYTYEAEEGYEVVGNATFDKAGYYDITLRLIDPLNYVWEAANGDLLQGATATARLKLDDGTLDNNGGVPENLWLILSIVTAVVIVAEVVVIVSIIVHRKKKANAGNETEAADENNDAEGTK